MRKSKSKKDGFKSPHSKYRAKYYEYLKNFSIEEDSEILEIYNDISTTSLNTKEFTTAYKAAILLLSLYERDPKLTLSNSKTIESKRKMNYE
jgi:hypothetical protein